MPYLRRHSTAVIVLLLALAAVAAATFAGGGRMFSPGPLNAQTRKGVALGGVTSHADLGTNCAACHAAPWGQETMATRCLGCHTDIRADLDAHHSLHGNMANGTQCRSCHTEHKGAHASLTNFSKFDHDMTAFRLTGKHQAVDCKSCHIDSVYKGTSQSCASCHAEPQVHRGRFGTNCASCHSTNTWESAVVDKSFDHDCAAFKLTGKHRNVDCKSCHVNNVYQGTPQSCASCHAEPQVHTGKFGTDCASCHSTSNWESVAVDKSFDHNRAAFKLTGKHSSVDCKSCHVNNVYLGTPQSCASCHAEPKVHTGKFGTDCASCHSTNTWTGAVVDKSFDHDRAAFKLTGKHKSIDCKTCHVNGVYKGTSQTCVGCHAEPKVHTGKFGTDCASCHSTNTWAGAIVDKSFDHDRAAFKLTGKHKTVECKMCHVNGMFKGTAQTCVGCHAEPKVHTGKFGTDCASCHTTNTWEGATFKHTFPINHGKGKPNACTTCHKVQNDYKTYTCYGCHEHEPMRIARRHKNVVNIDNCFKCHKGGRGKGRGALDREDRPDLGLCCAREEDCDGCPGQGHPQASGCPGADGSRLRDGSLADRVIDGAWNRPRPVAPASQQTTPVRQVRDPAVRDDPLPQTADRGVCDDSLAALPGAIRRRGRLARRASRSRRRPRE